MLNFVYGDAYQSFMMKLFGLSEPLHFLHTLAVVFVATLIILFAFSRGQRDEYSATVMPASNVEINLEPWRFARIAGALISVTTIICYIALAQ